MYLEDLPIGQHITCGSFSLSAADIIDFAVKYDPQPWHLDDALARETYFQGLCASGLHSQAAAIGLMVRAIQGVAIVAGGALNEARFLAPVRPDQRYEVTANWSETRPSTRNAARGVAVIDIVACDAAGVVVMQAGVTYVVSRRPVAA